MGFKEVQELRTGASENTAIHATGAMAAAPIKHDQQVNSNCGSVAHEGAVHAGLVEPSDFVER